MFSPNKPTREAVALAIPRGNEADAVLVVRWPEEPGEDLPGVWGLPAASLQDGETIEKAAIRVGKAKLGVDIDLGECLERGRQERSTYILDMVVYRASFREPEPRLPVGRASDGVTRYTAWRWADVEALGPGAAQGSLCSQLYLRWRGA